MSAVTWKGNCLFQRVGNFTEELGYIAFDNNLKTYFLWLKDTFGHYGMNGGYIRGDEFPSLSAAKQNAAISMSATMHHMIWIRNVGRVGPRNGPPINKGFKQRVLDFLYWFKILTALHKIGEFLNLWRAGLPILSRTSRPHRERGNPTARPSVGFQAISDGDAS